MLLFYFSEIILYVVVVYHAMRLISTLSLGGISAKYYMIDQRVQKQEALQLPSTL
jgi:hypothetical protein